MTETVRAAWQDGPRPTSQLSGRTSPSVADGPAERDWEKAFHHVAQSAKVREIADGALTQLPSSDQSSFEANPYPYPSPYVRSRREPEMRTLLEEHRAGRLEPVPVRLGDMPARASRAMHAVAEDMALRMGLRLAVDEDRPLPYAATEVVKAGILSDPRRASRTIRRLVEAGVVLHVGALPPRRGMGYGTKLYAPPPQRPSLRLVEERGAS